MYTFTYVVWGGGGVRMVDLNIYMSCSCSPLISFLDGRFSLILLFLKFSALIRDDKHFARVQVSAINKPIIHIFSYAGRELATVKVYNMSSF